ncbi:50S ribosomal protein L32 [Neochlamydia sp. EPS4]|jgi:large subunit ribosomal protein L32|uniref:50S ribosomal protein L32 n=1 Tax=unclassified Neochlamydia TaxID=2643326 RepID=UPI00057DEF8F|nr:MULTISPECIES: 50S ribosomal protein L32 [unclassified Neochlamydia]KIC73811.1 50S ribosomal protein L32 [Neochlamydia sp. TUME1]KIC75290.1 50S ribosomal protein L32 [Neochlamydia sp. EPS4]MBS4166932.1 50S ribosomal protein L32 [Neochlamydia sp. AcF65]MBS4170689.1 50S ribosomal protein L32 [Neochlamydia sp. AcF95]NGY95438.1 50S ribosomal protein L32 [Neochlamydia sp. AcF84]
MAVPRNRHSNARKNSKRAHHAKKPKQLANCSNCQSPKLPHVVCPSCGQYNGRVVMARKA